MSYEIKSARFANDAGTAIVINTEDQGDVAISERDRPELWQKCMAWRDAGGAVTAYQAPVVDKPRKVETEVEGLKRAILAKGVLTAAELNAAIDDSDRAARGLG